MWEWRKEVDVLWMRVDKDVRDGRCWREIRMYVEWGMGMKEVRIGWRRMMFGVVVFVRGEICKEVGEYLIRFVVRM